MEPKYKPYVPANSTMPEFTWRAIIIGLIMSLILGAANAYLGLKAGMTIAATYPAAVIGMAVLRLFKSKSILEENIARTIGSIGESVAAGAIFTLPAFLISGIWTDLMKPENFLISACILFVGGLIGILFVTVLRRVMVEDHELPFPESIAASEIHKAGQAGTGGALLLGLAMVIGGFIKFLGELQLFAKSWERFFPFPKSHVNLTYTAPNIAPVATELKAEGGVFVTTPGVNPSYMGVGYIIGPTLACLNFSGGLMAWGLFVPLLMWLLGPQLPEFIVSAGGSPVHDMGQMAYQLWKFIVRPIAIGGMLVSAVYTLYNMRKSLAIGLVRAVTDIRKAAGAVSVEDRTEKDIDFKIVFALLLLAFIATVLLYYYFAGSLMVSIVVALIMIIVGFLFAAVSGYLVGLIGSSNNPISGLTIATVVIAALLMVALGAKGTPGIAAVLGVAAVICVSAAVAGEMLQDLKVGHILGGTPWRMQIGDIIGILPASFVMVAVLAMMHTTDTAGGLGGKNFPAPQAGLMAMLSQGIVGGDMTWGLIIIGIVMGLVFILLKVKSPMLVSVGMYLPFETTAAIFLGGIVKWIVDLILEKKKISQKIRESVENTGVLVASGLIAGEALMGLLIAFCALFNKYPPALIQNPSFITSIFVIGIIGVVLAAFPIKNANELLALQAAGGSEKSQVIKEEENIDTPPETSESVEEKKDEPNKSEKKDVEKKSAEKKPTSKKKSKK